MQVAGDLVGRKDAYLDRQHQRDEDGPERRHPEREREEHDRIGRDDRDRDLSDRDSERHDQAVQHHAADRRARGLAGAGNDGVPVGLEPMRAGIERHLAVGDHRVVVGRGDDRQIDRKGDDRDAGQQDQMGQQVSEAAVLDHGVQ